MTTFQKHQEVYLNHKPLFEPALNNNGAIVEFAFNSNTGSLKFREKITCQTGNDGTKNVEIVVPLKW